MTEQLPKDTLSSTPRTDAVVTYWHLMQRETVHADFARQLERELTAARLALTGIASCSTCEACRGAATLALGGSR
jgi:hypothetical protein